MDSLEILIKDDEKQILLNNQLLAIEKLEDEYDMKLIKDYELRKENNKIEYVSFEEIKEVFLVQ